MLVRFSDQDEFLRELDADPGAIVWNIVRVTTMRYPIMSGTLTRLVVVATAKTHTDDLVEFTRLCGDLWGLGEKDDEVVAKANGLVEELTEELERRDFRVRAGRYENVETLAMRG